MQFNKLVRDRIPEIIQAQDRTPVTRVLDEAEYEKALRSKLLEEAQEYEASGAPEELADVLEVMLAILDQQGITMAALEALRRDKQATRGGFSHRICLIETR